jgi:glycosyltransferase involved in cell wall biosynthesis
VLRIAETVSRLDCDIMIIGRESGDCCNINTIPFKTKRFRMIFRRGFLFYKFYNIRLFFHLIFNRYDVLVANDLDTLLPNFIISELKRLPLVYDSHEYFTGVPEVQNRPFIKWVWKSIEKLIFPHLKHVMTVSDSIATQYEGEYGVRPITVRNCSRKADQIIPFTREELGVSHDHILLILQGTGINVDRGGEELIEAISTTERVSLFIVGSGDMLPDMKGKVLKLNLSQRVTFIPKLPWEEMMRYTKTADAGFSLDKDTNLNYRFSLPNKLFDYLAAGIPVIAGSLPEISQIVNEYKCGIIIPEVTPQEICMAINELKDKPGLMAELKRNAVIASESVNWEKESTKVIVFYNNVLSDIITR